MRFNAYSALFSLTITSLVTSSSAYMHGVMKHHRARGLTDTCAYVNSGLSINAPSYGLQYFGLLQSCLCIADLGTFITSSTVAAEAVKVAGLTLTTTTISNLILDAAGERGNCRYPPYSVPSCVATNPCGYECSSGYAHSGDTCVLSSTVSKTKVSGRHLKDSVVSDTKSDTTADCLTSVKGHNLHSTSRLDCKASDATSSISKAKLQSIRSTEDVDYKHRAARSSTDGLLDTFLSSDTIVDSELPGLLDLDSDSLLESSSSL